MGLRKKHKEGAEVFTEALNDIMFFLLLFFLIIATMVTPNAIKINLPSSKSAPQMQQKEVVLQISKDHRFFINQVEVTFDALETGLKVETEKKQSNTVILRLDQELTVQDLADVLQIGHNLQLKMLLATTSARNNQ